MDKTRLTPVQDNEHISLHFNVAKAACVCCMINNADGWVDSRAAMIDWKEINWLQLLIND